MQNAPLKACEIIGATRPKILLPNPFRRRGGRRNRVLCQGLNTAPQIPIPSGETAPTTVWSTRPCWVTSELPDPVPRKGIHLAEEWETHHKKEVRRARSGGVFTGASIGLEVGMLAATMPTILVMAFMRSTMGAQGILIYLVILLVVAVIALIWRAAINQPADPNFVYPVYSDPRYRLRAVGSRRRLESLRTSEIDLESGFEPAIFRITFAVEPKYSAGRKTCALFVVGLIVVVMTEVMFGTVPQGAGYITLLAALCFARFSRALIWPTYLRIVPGRMDVLQYGFLGRGRPRVRSYDLRTSRLYIHINSSLAVFATDSNDGELLPAVSTGWFQNDPVEFERTLLTAALTDLPSPPLPDVELIG